MSTKLSRASYTIALVGATGSLGREVANVFLTSYKPFFSRVIVTARDTTTAEAKALAEKGAELVLVSAADPLGSFTKAFEGADAVVNVIGSAPNDFKDAIGEAAIKSGAKVYFPSEYGSDHRINDFPGWDDPGWLWKGQHARKYRQLGAGKTKVVALYNGLFLEILINPFFGFDTANLTYTSVGSPDAKTATTAKADIGRALAELTLLSLNPETAASVPDDVHIAGSNVSWRQIRDIVQKVRDELGVEPRGEIKVQGTDLAPFREKLRKEQLEKPKPGPIDHIKVLIAEGKMDFTKNDNELINPGESIWKWKTVEDIVREKGGRV
ncbi:NAD(P)-binding protein [Daedalea quercina L-15889]|uniref:NAD(P)-binding protein n=1 Tax=Daedalea quercina L-15889 TaxID=1314783 RepID=A0A165PBM7_9APHY|nr:NAD(P)-binding protein [Daedalea quercina L-15889]